MRLYEYLENNLTVHYAWEDYTFDEADIPELKGNFSLLCDVWDLLNDWSVQYAECCNNVDAALIAKILTETISLIRSLTETEPISIQSAADLCSLYGRGCVFSKNIMEGSEYLEKCKLIVNNTIANCIFSKGNSIITFSDINDVDLDEGWESL